MVWLFNWNVSEIPHWKKLKLNYGERRTVVSLIIYFTIFIVFLCYVLLMQYVGILEHHSNYNNFLLFRSPVPSPETRFHCIYICFYYPRCWTRRILWWKSPTMWSEAFSAYSETSRAPREFRWENCQFWNQPSFRHSHSWIWWNEWSWGNWMSQRHL